MVSLTIVTVVMNPGNALAKTVESVINQDFSDIEYIIVDGGSTDGTVERIRDFGSRVDRFITEPDQGIYDAMNKGCGLARGEWICFLNAGDSFLNHRTLSNLFREKILLENADIVYGDTVLRCGERSELWKAGNPDQLLQRNTFCHQSSIVRRSALLQYPFDTRFRICADARFFMQCFMAGLRFTYFPGLTTSYDTGGLSSDVRRRLLERWYITHELGVDTPQLDARYLKRMREEAGIEADAEGSARFSMRIAGKLSRLIKRIPMWRVFRD